MDPPGVGGTRRQFSLGGAPPGAAAFHVAVEHSEAIRHAPALDQLPAGDAPDEDKLLVRFDAHITRCSRSAQDEIPRPPPPLKSRALTAPRPRRRCPARRP